MPRVRMLDGQREHNVHEDWSVEEASDRVSKRRIPGTSSECAGHCFQVAACH